MSNQQFSRTEEKKLEYSSIIPQHICPLCHEPVDIGDLDPSRTYMHASCDYKSMHDMMMKEWWPTDT